MLIWLYYLILLAIAVGGLALLALTLPGLWLMTAAAAGYALLTHRAYIGNKTLLTLLILTVAAELSDTFLGGAAAKQAGGGRRAMLGAFLGALAGALALSFVPIIGTIVGACLGSFVGAAVFELTGGSPPDLALRVGYGAAKGKLIGIATKFLTGIAMFLVILITAFP